MRFTKTVAVAVMVSAGWMAAQGRPTGQILHDAAGDVASNPGAKDSALSTEISHKAVRAAMKKVADWQLKEATGRYTQDWTYAPLYSGYLEASKTLKDARYHDEAVKLFDRWEWSLLPGKPLHADDQAIGQSYEALYREKRDALRIAAVKQNWADVMATKERPKQGILWWWCDALYMAPMSLAQMTEITGDRSYINFMDKEWDKTHALLYVPSEKLYFRDATFLKKTEANGKPMFWSRGNGWVLAGTARVLSTMKKDDPLRPKYEALFKDMAGRIAELQPADGLWRMGLLDEESYKMGEVSGSGFFVYAMAWGVNNGLLDKAKYMPVIEKGWAGMVKEIYADGRLGAIQPVGAAPDKLEAGSSWVYGVGAFLLAGSEIDKLAKN